MKIAGFQISRINKTLEAESAFYNELYAKYSEYTMVPKRTFISNLKLASNYIPEGSIVECGVWRGGMISALAEILGSNRSYYLFDSFEGLPPAKTIDGEKALAWQSNKNSKYYYNNCSADESYAIEALQKATIKNYKIVKGWFEKTIPNEINKIDKISVLRLDGDWYDSTILCLNYLFEKVVSGGLVIIDDYYSWDGCSKAVHEFLYRKKLNDQIQSTPEDVCYIIKK